MCELRRTVSSCVRLRARSCAHESREQLPPPPFRVARQSGYALCAREATSEGELRRLYLLLQNSCGRFRRRIFVLLKSRPYQAEPYKQALWACKARAKDSCRNFISKNALEILPRKILKFYRRLPFGLRVRTRSSRAVNLNRPPRKMFLKFYLTKFQNFNEAEFAIPTELNFKISTKPNSKISRSRIPALVS